MKKEAKDGIQQFKTAMKNEHLFLRMALRNGFGFFASLVQLSKDYAPVEPDFGKAYEDLSAVERFRSRDMVIACGEKITALLEPTKKAEFLKAVDSTIEEYSLGREWKETFIAFTMTGILCPPIFNLYIDNDNEITNATAGDVYGALGIGIGTPPRRQWGRLRTGIMLNPDTSVEDIKNAWPQIKKAQQASWSNWKGFNLTGNSAKQLRTQLSLIQAKHAPIPVDEKLENMSFYESERIKRGGGMTTKEILKYRKDGGGDAVRKSTVIKQERTDAETIKQLFKPKSKKEALKLVNRLRQEKSRMSKK